MTHLYKVNRTYYFRVRIPADLREWFGGREDFKRSLKTTSLKNARSLVRVWGYHAERMFTTMRTGFLTKAQIEQLAQQFFRETLNELEEHRASGRGPRNEEALADHLEAMEYHDSDLREDLALNKYQRASHLADDLLERNGLTVEKKSTEYALLCRSIMVQSLRIGEIEQKRAVGDYSDGPVLVPEVVSLPSQSTPPAPQESPLLSSMIDKFMEDYRRNESANENTLTEYESICKFFLQVVGNRPVKSITRDDLRAYVDTLKKLPPHINKKKEYRNKTITEIIAMGEKTIGPATIEKYIMILKSFFKSSLRLKQRCWLKN